MRPQSQLAVFLRSTVALEKAFAICLFFAKDQPKHPRFRYANGTVAGDIDDAVIALLGQSALG